MSDIKPIDLPSAAALEFGRGDVRHFSEDDAVDVPGLQTPTRHLAQRDNALATKVNEVIGVVNNKEQFVPLVLPKTTVPPGTEEILTNFKIPEGFEARVLNATIGSSPASSALVLKIYYATGYGNLTGTELVSTTSSFTAGVAFYNDGEFIVAVRNGSSGTIETAASITLTIRPIGSQTSLLVGSIIRGPRGYVGGKGDHGGRGDPGVGGAGVPGLIWRSAYSGGTSYNPGDVVSYLSGGLTGSYVCKLATIGNAPTNATYWDVLALGSAGTAATPFNPRGPWLTGSAYVVNDVVSASAGAGQPTNLFICKANINPSNVNPNTDLTNFMLAVSGTVGAETPVYAVTDLSASTTYTATATGGADGDYGAVAASGTLPSKEFSVINTVGTYKGLVFIYGYFLLNLPAGAVVTVTLPVSAATSGQWTNTEVALCAAAQGNRAVEGGTNVKLIDVSKVSTTQWVITSLAAASLHLDVLFNGLKIKS